jgi:hypothetical protein
MSTFSVAAVKDRRLRRPHRPQLAAVLLINSILRRARHSLGR